MLKIAFIYTDKTTPFPANGQLKRHIYTNPWTSIREQMQNKSLESYRFQLTGNRQLQTTYKYFI